MTSETPDPVFAPPFRQQNLKGAWQRISIEPLFSEMPRTSVSFSIEQVDPFGLSPHFQDAPQFGLPGFDKLQLLLVGIDHSSAELAACKHVHGVDHLLFGLWG